MIQATKKAPAETGALSSKMSLLCLGFNIKLTFTSQTVAVKTLSIFYFFFSYLSMSSFMSLILSLILLYPQQLVKPPR